VKGILTGSRYWTNVPQLERELDALNLTFLAVGDCPCQRCKRLEECDPACPGVQSADAIGFRWAKRKGIPGRLYRANWGRFRNAAGPIRSERMVRDNLDATVALACIVDFDVCKGTRRCAQFIRDILKFEPREIAERKETT